MPAKKNPPYQYNAHGHSSHSKNERLADSFDGMSGRRD